MRALSDVVIGKKVGLPAVSKAGLVISRDEIRDENRCLVTSVGPDVRSCKAGDKVIVGGFPFQGVAEGDDILFFFRDDEILAMDVEAPAVSVPSFQVEDPPPFDPTITFQRDDEIVLGSGGDLAIGVIENQNTGGSPTHNFPPEVELGTIPSLVGMEAHPFFAEDDSSE